MKMELLIGKMCSWQDNPMGQFERKYNLKSKSFIVNNVMSYQVINGLEIKAKMGYTQVGLDEFNMFPTTARANILKGYSNFGNNNIQSWIIEPQINYYKNIGPGKLSLSIGSTLQESITDKNLVDASGYTSDALLGTITAAENVYTYYDSRTLYRYNAVYGRVGYNIKEKYLFNLTGRRDGSNRFGPGKQFSNFGAIGAAWILSEERFLKNNIRFISFAKLRSSYGTTGSDQITDYGYYDLWV